MHSINLEEVLLNKVNNTAIHVTNSIVLVAKEFMYRQGVPKYFQMLNS